MIGNKELKDLSKARLKAAKLLYQSGDYDGAMYVGGYVLELALKSIICKRLNLKSYPDRGNAHTKNELAKFFHTHDFVVLATLAGISEEFTLNSPNEELFENWSTLISWKPDTRYQPIGTYSKSQAQRMIQALEEKPFGIITWIRRTKKW